MKVLGHFVTKWLQYWSVFIKQLNRDAKGYEQLSWLVISYRSAIPESFFSSVSVIHKSN